MSVNSLRLAGSSWLINGKLTAVKGRLKFNDNLALFEGIELAATPDVYPVKNTIQLIIMHPQRPHQSLRIKAF